MKALCSSALCLALGPAWTYQARADVIEVTSYLQGQVGTLGEPSVDTTPGQFNSALGTLTGVTLSYGISLQSGLNVPDGVPGFCAVRNTLEVYDDYVTGGPAGSPYASVAVAVPDSILAIPQNSSGLLLATNYVHASLSLTVNALYLDDLTGGNGGDVPYVGFYPYSQLYPNPGNIQADDDLDNIQVSIEETFTYTPVSEPASLGLLGLGLLANVIARYRRIRSAASPVG